MKKLILMLVLGLGFGTLFAQESVELKNAGNEALKNKNYESAFENYEKAIAAWGSDSLDYAMIYNTAFCAVKLKKFDKAIQYFDQSIAGNYKPEDAMFNKAVIYKMEKNTDLYLKTLNDGVAKYPEDKTLKGELAKYYLMQGNARYNNGAKLLKEAVSKVTAKTYKDTTDPAYLADIVKVKEEFKAAIPSLDKALELDPTNANAKALKGACEKQLKVL